MKQINIAIVGAGGIAKRHVEGLSAIESARIKAVVDIVPEKAEQLAALCGATAYGDLDGCLRQVDVVYVLTPPSFHRELAIEAMQAGKHVMVEKPIAIQLEDAEAMVAAARSAGVHLMVAFNMRFRRGFRRLKQVLDSGALGSPINVWSQRLGMGVGSGENWRTTPGLLCGMTVESLSHDIDLIRWLAGEIREVRALVQQSRNDLPGFDDNASILFTLASGATATIHASWSSHLGWNSRGIVGSRGTAMVDGRGLWDLTHFHLKTVEMEHETIEVLDEKLDVQSYREESRHFIDCLLQGRHPSISGEDGLQALRVSHAILTAQRENRPVSTATEQEVV
jgi:predicted dehydrogenase